MFRFLLTNLDCTALRLPSKHKFCHTITHLLCSLFNICVSCKTKYSGFSSCTVLSGSDLSEDGESVSGDEEFEGAVASAPAETQKVVDYLEF